MSDTRPQTFGEQAAKFSLYAPGMAFLLGAMTSRTEGAVRIAIGGLNLLLLVAGLIFGIVALSLIKKYGKERILGRAIAGVVINAVLLLAVATLLLPLMTAGNVRAKVAAGTWHMKSNPDPTVTKADLTFNSDGTYVADMTQRSLDLHMTGHWTFSRLHDIGMTIENVNGITPKTSESLVLGNVESVDDKQMTLRTDKGKEFYQR